MCNNNENNSCCFSDTLSTIVKIQNQGQCPDVCTPTCDRPFLGLEPSVCLYNTRPINIYPCGSNVLWTMPYTTGDTEETSTVFRCEACEGCCATFRVLAPNPDTTSENPYIATNSFFTMNLKCAGAIRCLADTFVTGL